MLNRLGPSKVGNWWNCRCGLRETLWIAAPLIVSTASWSMTSFVDRLFLFWYAPLAMAAALPAGMLHLLLLCLPMGLASYLNTFVAQYDGAKQPEQIGAVIRKGVLVSSLLIPIFLLTIPLADPLFTAVGHDDGLQSLETRYFQILALGGGASVVAAALATFFSGRGKTSTIMFVELGSCGLNILLDGLFIFGLCGEWLEGMNGAAAATVLSQWYKVLAYLLLLLQPALSGQFKFFDWNLSEPGLLSRILRYGTANGIQVFLEVLIFTGFMLFIGRLGTTSLTASSLAWDVNSLTFVPLIGLSIAVSTLVGREIGNNDPVQAKIAARSGLAIAMTYSVLMALAYWFLPNVFLAAHFHGVNPVQLLEVKSMVSVLLKFVAFFCICDALNLILVSVLKGAGDVRFVFIIGVGMAIVLFFATLAANRYAGPHIYTMWLLMSVWMMFLAFIHSARFFSGYWVNKRVIGQH